MALDNVKESKKTQVLKIDRDVFLEMIESCFEALNKKSKKNKEWVRHLFQKCGQDPKMKYETDMAFREHLASFNFDALNKLKLCEDISEIGVKSSGNQSQSSSEGSQRST
jgi:hypothetical protein